MRSICSKLFSSRSLVVAFLLGAVSAADPAWNYAKGGTDWTDKACIDINKVQAPINVIHNGTDWYVNPDSTQFAFLPSYTSAKADKSGVVNYVYQLSGEFGNYFATEPSKNPTNNMVKWEAESIRFHYPSEHKVLGEEFDLEM